MLTDSPLVSFLELTTYYFICPASLSLLLGPVTIIPYSNHLPPWDLPGITLPEVFPDSLPPQEEHLCFTMVTLKPSSSCLLVGELELCPWSLKG